MGDHESPTSRLQNMLVHTQDTRRRPSSHFCTQREMSTLEQGMCVPFCFIERLSSSSQRFLVARETRRASDNEMYVCTCGNCLIVNCCDNLHPERRPVWF